MTNKQKQAIEKARRYKKNTFHVLEFRRAYRNYVEEGYVSPTKFVALVRDTAEVKPIRQPKPHPITLEEHLDVYRRNAMQ